MQKPYKVNQFGGMGAMYADNDKLAHAQARESYRNFLKSTKPINAAEFIQSKNALETELISAYEALRTAQIAVADLKWAKKWGQWVKPMSEANEWNQWVKLRSNKLLFLFARSKSHNP